MSDNYDDSDDMITRHIMNAEENDSVKRVSTSVNIDETLWKELRVLAIERGTTATELLGVAISEYLQRQKSIK